MGFRCTSSNWVVWLRGSTPELKVLAAGTDSRECGTKQKALQLKSHLSGR